MVLISTIPFLSFCFPLEYVSCYAFFNFDVGIDDKLELKIYIWHVQFILFLHKNGDDTIWNQFLSFFDQFQMVVEVWKMVQEVP